MRQAIYWMYSEPMNLWILFWIFGLVVMASMRLIIRMVESDNDEYCDHGPSVYDSYCVKCGLDS